VTLDIMRDGKADHRHRDDRLAVPHVAKNSDVGRADRISA